MGFSSMFAKPGKSVQSTVAKAPEKAASSENSEQIAKLKAEQASAKLNTMGATRTPDEIRESGVLDAFAKLEGVHVPKSEFDRTVEDDAILVQQGLAKLTPEQIDELKKSALKHPEVERDLPGAMDKKHYGSPRHLQYAQLIQELSGGVISVEEAMAMNPSGGIPGAGMSEIPFFGSIDPIARHAMIHDACGFMLTRFGIGPGYGTKTSAMGLSKDNPMAGQFLGIAREIFNPSDLPGGDGASTAAPLLGLGVGQKAQDAVTGAGAKAAGVAGAAGSAVADVGSSAVDGAGGLAKSAGSTIAGGASGAAGAVKGGVTSAGSAAKSGVTSAGSAAKSGLSGAFGSAKSGVSGAGSSAKKGLSSVGKKVSGWF